MNVSIKSFASQVLSDGGAQPLSKRQNGLQVSFCRNVNLYRAIHFKTLHFKYLDYI
jgi:hypothetical protein